MSSKLILLLLLIPAIAFGQTKEGIAFESLSWSQLLSKAKEEKKIIFLDAYASWCGPCKAMTSQVFTQEEVGNFYNKNFINAKIDMEVGEGETIAQRYQVAAYPTYLFIDGDGKLVHKALGYVPAGKFLEVGHSAIDPDRQYYTLLERAQKGNLDEKKHYALVMQAIEMGDEQTEFLAAAYLSKQSDWLTAESINLILKTESDPTGKYFQYLIQNQKKAGEIVGEKVLEEGLDNIAFKKVATEIEDGESIGTTVAKVEAGMKKYRPAGNAKSIAYKIGQYLADQQGDQKTAMEYRLKLMNEFSDELSWSELNEAAWGVYENETDRKLLQAALQWGLKSVSKDKNYYNTDTVAHLYFKLGDKTNARAYAKQAITLGKADGEDVSETEKLLKKL
jgi:thiol-disulfide isomerase/thioredoxin